MFWIVLIIILLLAIAGLFFIRAQSEQEWVREVSEWQENKGGQQAELPEIQDRMPNFPELGLMIFHAVKAAVCWLSVNIVRFCRNYLAHESEPDKPASFDPEAAAASSGYADKAMEEDEGDEAVNVEDISSAVIGNRCVPSNRDRGENSMPSEASLCPCVRL